MDHPFLTRRHEIARDRDHLGMCEDLLLLLDMSADDHARVISRRESEIRDTGVRDAVRRRSFCLSLVPTPLVEAGMLDEGDARAWSAFLMGEKIDTKAVRSRLDDAKTSLEEKLKEIESLEHDTGSSSYSDYSDSDTVSSSSSSNEGEESGEEESGEEESGEEESGEEEEESEEESPVKRPRRRR